ncbi:uncharacterized protein LOC132743274 [Ruditapes philippinarum]|uniref:uncharacterized protein LOC132743274 n=1 Tax=Ruditapes philippinarum TaxID=129788 RepID=UPI00295AE610|nr:uncharacterized protein LOC132743274 [Ruditapes philippinarum]
MNIHLFYIVTCCLLPIHLDSSDRLNCSFDFCHSHDSFWWKHHASYCLRCLDSSSDRIYHCARDYDNPEIFKEGCAIEKNCLAGEEPHLSFKRNGQEIDDPDVYSVTCFDNNFYNSVNKSSSTYSECPDKKWNDCSEGTHKILCKPDDSKNERFCRCDARKGYVPINVQSFEMCSIIDYKCKKKECPKLPSGKPQQRLLNYTCAPYCEEGYDRLREDSDVCEPLPTMKTAIVIKPNSSTKPLVPVEAQISWKFARKVDMQIEYGSSGAQYEKDLVNTVNVIFLVEVSLKFVANLDMELYVEAPQSDRSVVDGNATVEDERVPSHMLFVFLSYKF